MGGSGKLWQHLDLTCSGGAHCKRETQADRAAGKLIFTGLMVFWTKVEIAGG